MPVDYIKVDRRISKNILLPQFKYSISIPRSSFKKPQEDVWVSWKHIIVSQYDYESTKADSILSNFVARSCACRLVIVERGQLIPNPLPVSSSLLPFTSSSQLSVLRKLASIFQNSGFSIYPDPFSIISGFFKQNYKL